MGIYLANMEMPKSCYVCPFCDYVSARCDAVNGNPYTPESRYEKRADFCPLIPVPPHGRLGDLDALYEKFSRLESEAMNALKTTTTGSVNWWSAILTERTGYKYDIADAPTVIPAEEGET